MRIVRYVLIITLITSFAYAFSPQKKWGGEPFGGGKWGASSSGGSGTTYWGTAMSDRWNTPMAVLWNTSMNTEIP